MTTNANAQADKSTAAPRFLAFIPWFNPSYWNDRKRMIRDWALLAILTVLAFAFPIRTAATKEAAIVLALISWCFGIFIVRRSAWLNVSMRILRWRSLN